MDCRETVSGEHVRDAPFAKQPCKIFMRAFMRAFMCLLDEKPPCEDSVCRTELQTSSADLKCRPRMII